MIRVHSHLIRISYLSVVSLLTSFHTSAQVFPVQVTTQLSPPYTPYLSDYTTPGAQKLMVQIRLNDPTITSYICKLRLMIEGVGITLRTKPGIFLNPITLQGGGTPELFYGADLQEYFRPDHLDFSGLSRAQYEKSASLPDGVYRFTIEVLDYNRNVVVSNKGTSVAWMIRNDPPLLNLPAHDAKILLVNPTNIPFTWTPRHTGSPNAAFTTEYIFRLVEMAPGAPSSQAQYAVLSQPALYELTTSHTQIIYGMSEPALIPGRKYAWLVQAKEVDGRDLFKNEGRSEVYVFQFGDAIGIPENMRLQNVNSSTLTVRWQLNAATSITPSYRVSYRPHQNRANEQWYELQTNEPWKSITQLNADTEYEVRVRAEQGTLFGEYNAMQVYHTKPVSTTDFVCKSNVPPPPTPVPGLPFFGVRINDTIRAAGYDVLVRHVSGVDGVYTGDGVAIVPWFNSSKVRVTFKNIGINAQLWLTSGVIESVWDTDSKMIIDVPADTLVKPGSTPVVGNIPVTIAATDSLIRIKGAAIAAVTKDPNGNTIVSTTDGKQQVIEKGKSYSVADEIGNGYVVDKEGHVTKTSASEVIAAAERGSRDYNIILQFEKGLSKYGFDEPPQGNVGAALASYYQSLNDNKKIAWKLIENGATDVVGVRNGVRAEDGFDVKKVQFDLNGSTLTPSMAGNETILNVPGQGDGATLELLAHTDGSKEVIGKLNVISYNKIIRNLVLVPVNGNKLSVDDVTIARVLNEIYAQAAVEWSVKTEENITVDLRGEFDDGAGELLSNYTDDMKKVINRYASDHSFAIDTYYLFLVDRPKSPTKAGYLPRKKQAGFLFINNLSDKEVLIKTIAHELGHGAFRLKHTFDEFPSLTEKTTNNLMDYRPDGTHLHKYQWDYIHDPEAMIGLFEDEEDGEFQTDGHYSTVYLIGKLLGIPNYKKLAWYTEFPDNEIHERYAMVKTTWAERDHQVATHALTWGYHNIEEFKTCVAFLNANINDTQEIGRLLHRYGDCYAHTRLEDTLKPYLEKRMYGDTITFKRTAFGITLEHMTVDGSRPDLISERPDWYLEYVTNVADLLALKFGRNSKTLDFSIFRELSRYAKDYNVSLIGIINYHIAKIENRNQFTIPFPKSTGSLLSDQAASGDQKEYVKWVRNTQEYFSRKKIKYDIKRTVKTYTYTDNFTSTSVPIPEEVTFLLK